MKAGKTIHIVLIALILAIVGSHLLLNSEKIQQNVADYAGTYLAEALGTEVSTESISLTHPCGISVKHLLIKDHLGDTLISASGATIQFRILPLLNGKMDVTRISLINPYINIYRQDSGSATNLGGVLVHTQSDSEKKNRDGLILRANSIYIRNGKLHYNVLSDEHTPQAFNSSHIQLNNITTRVSLKHLSQDSINARLRKLSFSEHCGIRITKAYGAIKAGKENLLINNLALSTPNSNAAISRAEAFKSEDGFIWNVMMQSSVRGSDFAPLLPQLETMNSNIAVNLQADGDKNRYNINELEIGSAENFFNIGLNACITNHNDGSVPYSINDFSIEEGVLSSSNTTELHRVLTEQLAGFDINIPAILEKFGACDTHLEFEGDIEQHKAVAEITSDAGDALLQLQSKEGRENISLQSSGLNLGRILSNADLGDCSIDLEAVGNLSSPELSGSFSGSIRNLEFRRYTYNEILLDGSLTDDTISTNVRYNDENANILAYAKVLPDATDTYTSLTVDVQDLNLSNLNLAARDSMVVSAKIAANTTGNTLDLIKGELTIDSLYYCDSEGKFHTKKQFLLTLEENGYDRRDLSIESCIVNADIVGDYKLSTLPKSLALVAEQTLPTLSEWLLRNKPAIRTDKTSTDRFVVDIQLPPTDFYEKVLHLPLEIREAVMLQCNVNGSSSLTNAIVHIPDISISNNYIRNGSIDLESDNGNTNINIDGNYSSGYNPGNSVSIALNAVNDSVDTSIEWKSVDENNLNFNITALTVFEDFNKAENWIKSFHHLEESGITFNGVDWDLSKFYVNTDSGKISIDDFKLSNSDQLVFANGIISADSTDVLKVIVDNINIGKLFDMLNAENVSFGGIASADISAMSLLDAPGFYGNIIADDFHFLGSYGGHLEAEGIWNEESDCIDIVARMNDGDKATTLFNGYYSPKNSYIDITIDADNTDMYFLNTFTKNIFKEVKGNAFGQLRLFGHFDTLDLEGKAILENGELYQDLLNTRFYIKHDTLSFEPGRMIFRNVDFYDAYNNKGLLMCELNHRGLNDFSADLEAYITNMQVLNIPRTEATDIFANVFATGTVNLTTSNSYGLIVNANATTAPGTTFGYNLSAGPVADNSFLKIVDASAATIENIAEEKSLTSNKKKNKKKVKEINTDVQLNFSIDCTEDAEIELLMDPLAGSVYGSGLIRASYSNKQGVSLLGRYNVARGICDFSLENLIRKEFRFSGNNDSYVTFNGHPSTAELNLHTYHTVNSASLSDLDVNLSSDNNVRVNCLMDITGTVISPELAFNIELPQGSQEEKEAIASSTSTEEQKNLQFMYLLTVGRFYSYDYANTNTTSPGAVESFINNTFNTQINNLLSQVVNNNNFSLSSNVSAGSYLNNDPANLTDKELEGILEAHLLNNRLLINGNFGYRENAMTNTSNFIGDIEVEWLLLKKPKISLRGYNKNNDKYFSKTSLTTQGIGIVYEADF